MLVLHENLVFSFPIEATVKPENEQRYFFYHEAEFGLFSVVRKIFIFTFLRICYVLILFFVQNLRKEFLLI